MIFASVAAVVALATALAQTEIQDEGRCYPLTQPVIIDGDLGEWDRRGPIRIDRAEQRDLREGGVLSRAWGGPEDCSGTFYFAYDDQYLYLAGEVRDDDRVANNEIWFNGDCVELFLDTNRGADPDTFEFDDAAFQLCLMPYNPARAWGVLKRGNKNLLADGDFHGVRVASRPTQGAGYTFESRWPFANFPELGPTRAGIGFNIALNDHDRSPSDRESYLTVNGRGYNFLTTENLLPLLVVAPEGSLLGTDVDTQSSSFVLDWVIAVAAALVLIVLVSLGARPLYTFIDARLRSWRRLGVMVIGTVLFAVYGVPWLVSWLQESSARDEFAARASAASAVIADFSEGIALHEGRGLDQPDAMLRLLRGDVVQIRPDYEYTSLDLRPAAEDLDRRVSVEDVPVREFGFPLAAGRTHYFPLAKPVPLSRLYVFGSSRLADRSPGASRSPNVHDPVVEIGVRLADGGVYTEMFPAIDHALIRGGERPISARFGRGWIGPDAEVDSYFLGKAALDDRAVQAVMIAVHDPAVSFRLHGVTVAARKDDVLTPLSLSHPSEAGPPAPLWDGFPKNAVVSLSGGGGAANHTVPVERSVDALWFFYSTRDAGVLAPALAGIEVARITARTADGEPVVQPIRAGVHLTYGLADPSKRPADMGSYPAFSWSSAEGTERIEVLEMSFPEAAKVTSIDIENLGQLAELRLFAVTAGSLARSGQIPSSSSLVRVARDRVRVKAELADSLEGLGFLVAAGGRVTAVDFPDPDVTDSLVGARYPLGSTGEAPDTAYRALLGSEEYLVRSFSFATETGPDLIVAAAYPIEGMARLERLRDQASAVALLLILPFLLFHVLDGTSRAASIRVRLTALLVATSLIPIVLLFAVLYNVVSKDRSRLRESRATAAMQQVVVRLDRMFVQTQRAAREILEGEVVRAIRATGVIDKARVEAYLQEVISLRPVPGLELAARLDVALPDGSRLRFHDRPGGDAASRFDELPPGLHHHWDRLLMVATQTRVETAGQVTVTLAGDLRRELIEELSTATGSRVSLLTMRGFPLAGSSEGNALRRAGDVEQIRRQNQLAYRESRSGELVATGLLGVSGGGDPAGLIEVALPGDSFQLALLFGELPLKTFFFWFCVLGLLFAVFMGSVATWRITGPIETLQTAAQQVAMGDLNALVRVSGRGEVARLARTFNAMVTELKARANERQRTDVALSRLSARMDLEHTAEELTAVLCDAPAAMLGALYRRDPDLDRLVRTGQPFGDDEVPPERLEISGPFADVLSGADPLLLPIAQEASSGSQDVVLGSGLALLVPLWVSDRAVGLVLIKYPPSVFRSEVEAATPLLKQLASSGAAALENARLYQMAVVDPHTGLHVESYFLSRLAEEVDLAVARATKVSIVRIRIEGLDRIHPTQRVEVARDALTRVALSTRAVSRDMYLIARSEAGLWLLLPETSGEEANQVVAKLDLTVVSAVPTRDAPALATYVGVAAFPDDGRSSAQLIDAAERDLSAARRKQVERALRPAPSSDPADGLDLHPFVFQSQVMRALLSQVARVAPSNAPILLLGETGVGKEVVAELVHRFSDRPHRAFVALNCSALPEALLEAELFGYEKGAFTGAHRAKPGQLEVADGGTLFLDEVGDMPLSVQSKLLRVLQDHRFVRLGGERPVQTDVRLVAATNRDLQALIAVGSFRSDLYYRLKGVEFRIAPLRDRREEIPDLVDRFVAEFSRDRERPISFSTAALDELYRYDWPGNVRELRAVVQRAILLSDGDLILPGALEFPRGPGAAATPGAGLPRASRAYPDSAQGGAPSDRERRGARPDRGGPVDDSSTPGPNGGRSARTDLNLGSLDGLNDRQRTFLSWLSAGQMFRSSEYIERVGVSPRTGLRDLSDLMDKGHIVRLGRRRAAVYRRT